MKQTYFSSITLYGWGKLSHKERAGGYLYYIDYNHKTLISAFCVLGNYSIIPTITEKKQNKEAEIFLIDHDIYQSFCELVNTG